jgi:hypothetical protein
MDRDYMDFTRLALIAQAGAFFDTRAKSNLYFKRHHPMPVDRFTGLRSGLFFRWIKALLRIKRYYSKSANAVKTQTWVAVCTYFMFTILQQQLKLPGDLHSTLQI